MYFHLQEVTEALQRINPILKTEHPYPYEYMIEAVLNSCLQVISMAHLKAISDGFVFDTWCRQSNAFKDFMGLYGEFCSHVCQLSMDEMDTDDKLVETLTKLRDM